MTALGLMIWSVTAGAQTNAGGVVVRWGDVSWNPLTFARLTNVVSVAGGFRYEALLTSDGDVHVAADPSSAALLQVPGRLTNIIAVASGANFLLVLDRQGIVRGFGLTQVPQGLSNVVAIACGPDHALALKAAGTVVAWGDNAGGKATVPAGLSQVTAIAAGSYQSLALRADGKVVGWGSDFGQNNIFIGAATPPAGLSNVVSIAAGYFHSFGVRSDGIAVGWGDPFFATVPSAVNGRILSIAAGGYHALALLNDGSVAAWGNGSFGNTNVPPNLHGVISVHASFDTAYAITRGPTIVRQPEPRTAPAGTNVEFSVEALGVGDLTYQWRFNGADLPGQTEPGLGIQNVQAAHAGGYSVLVSNPFGVIASSAAALTVVPTAPSIRQLSESQAAQVGDTVTFTVVASGSEPLAYRWFHDGTLLPGAVGASLVLTNVQLADEGGYSVAVSNVLDQVVSPPAFLTLTRPVIVEQPSLKVVREGNPASFAVRVVSPGPVSYQWQRDGVDIPGATGPQLQFTSTTLVDARQYRVTVSNGLGSIQSTSAALHVISNPRQIGLPVEWGWIASSSESTELTNVLDAVVGGVHTAYLLADGTVTMRGVLLYDFDGQLDVPAGLGDVVQLAAGAHHTLALKRDGTVAAWGSRISENYGQWFVPADLNGVASVAAGKLHSLVLRTNGVVQQWPQPTDPAVAATLAGVHNVVGIAAGAEHNVAVRADGTVAAWGSLTQFAEGIDVPGDLTNAVAVAAGGFHSLALKADGTVSGWGNNSYGQATPPPDLRQVVAIAAGQFHSVAVLADGSLVTWGSTEYGARNPPRGMVGVTRVNSYFYNNIAVTAAPIFVRHPDSIGALAGTEVVFHGAVLSAYPVQYQWLFNGEPLIGAKGPELRLSGVTTRQIGSYTLVASNAYHTVQSAPATLTVFGPPFVVPVANLTATVGSDVVLSFTVLGVDPFTYQWWQDGQSLPACTNATLVITNIQADNAGSYQLEAANPYGLTMGPPLELIVSPSGPRWVSGPDNRSLREGEKLVLSVAVAGSEPFIYQWRRKGLPLPAQTNALFLISSVTDVDAGTYDVRVRNGYGEISSPAATVELVPSAPILLSLPRVMLGVRGQDLTIPVAIAGGRPLSVQWLHEGTNIPGGTPSLLLTNLAEIQTGRYGVQITNELGTMEAGPVEVRLLPAIEPMRVATWGRTVAPPGFDGVIGLAAGDNHGLALRAGGTVSGWGEASPAAVPAGLESVVAVAAGRGHSLALRNNGTVVAWGENNFGQTQVPTNLIDAVAIAAGSDHSLAVRLDGTVVAWGRNDFGQARPPATLTNVAMVAGGGSHSLALQRDGRIVGWGNNARGQSRVPAGLTNAAAIAAGEMHSLAVTGTSRLFAWGDNRAGQLALPLGLTNVAAVAAGGDTSLVLLSNAVLISAGDFRAGQRNLPLNLGDVQRIGMGGTFGVALSRSPLIWFMQSAARLAGGSPLVLNAAAAGTPPLAFQWFRNEVPIAGAVAPTYIVPQTSDLDTGTYLLTVTNPFGADTSDPVRVVIVYPATTRPHLAIPTRPAGTPIRLVISSELDAYYRVQISEDLIHWNDWRDFVGSGGWIEFFDLSVSPPDYRFYRILSP